MKPSVISVDDLKSLVKKEAYPSISIYFPTVRAVVETEENSLHLKNLLREAIHELGTRGLVRPDAEELLEPLEALMDDKTFWRYQLDGLALLRSPREYKFFRLAYSPDETIRIDQAFHVIPLLPAVFPQPHFYVLAVSRHSIRLLSCTPNSFDPVDLTDVRMPKTFEESLKYDDLQKPELQIHTMTGPGAGGPQKGGGRQHAFHGHGQGDIDEDKERLFRFFRAVDKGLRTLIDSKTPLILAGVEYTLPMYREASRHEMFLEETLEGNFDRVSDQDLHARAAQIIHRKMDDAMQVQLDRYGTAEGQNLASSSLEEILQANEMGRVDTLFVARGATKWGVFDPNSGLEEHREPKPESVELYELATRTALSQAADAYLLDPARMPGNGQIAAIFRF